MRDQPKLTKNNDRDMACSTNHHNHHHRIFLTILQLINIPQLVTYSNTAQIVIDYQYHS